MNGVSILLVTQVKVLCHSIPLFPDASNPMAKLCCFYFLNKSKIHLPLFNYHCLNWMLWLTTQIIQDQGTHSLSLLGCCLLVAHSRNSLQPGIFQGRFTSSDNWLVQGAKVWSSFCSLRQLWTAIPVPEFPPWDKLRICYNSSVVQPLPILISLTGGCQKHSQINFCV